MKFIFSGLNGIIADYTWYVSKIDEIDSWSEKTFGYQPRKGMALTFKQEVDKILFVLRWS